MNRDKELARHQSRAIEQWGLDLVASAMDSFATRVREEARHPDNSRATQGALLGVARSAEATAEGIRQEADRRKSPPAPVEITIRDRDGKIT